MLLSCATPPPDASAVLARSSQAMGAAQLNTLALHRRGHRLHLRPGLQGRRRLAEDHAALADAQHRLRHRRDARRDRAEPRRAARRRRLSALRPAAQRPVRERRARLEPGRHDARRRGRASSPTACISSGSRRTACSRRRCAAAPARAAARRREHASSFDRPGRFTATAHVGADGLVRAGRIDLRRPGARRHARRSRPTTTTATSAASSSRCGCGRRWAAIRCSTSRSRRCRSTRRWRCRCPRRRATWPSA